jgi:predicted RNA-binding Zn-ribbon protein involved in translation (DUF1610 family)
MLHFIERIRAKYCARFGRTYNCQCGHTAKWKTILTIDGNSGIFTLAGTPPEYCPQCFKKAIIKCAWCGNSITPGSPVTLHIPMSDFKIPEYAVRYPEGEHIKLVGCMRTTCSDFGMDREGFWIMPGKVQRVLSPLEMLMADDFTESVIVSDPGDMSKAILVPDKQPNK